VETDARRVITDKAIRRDSFRHYRGRDGRAASGLHDRRALGWTRHKAHHDRPDPGRDLILPMLSTVKLAHQQRTEHHEAAERLDRLRERVERVWNDAIADPNKSGLEEDRARFKAKYLTAASATRPCSTSSSSAYVTARSTNEVRGGTLRD
jgi:hypothetical protein